MITLGGGDHKLVPGLATLHGRRCRHDHDASLAAMANSTTTMTKATATVVGTAVWACGWPVWAMRCECANFAYRVHVGPALDLRAYVCNAGML